MKFDPEILFETQEFHNNNGETFDKYEGDDYEYFFNMYKGRKSMLLIVKKKAPIIPDDVYYLTVSIPAESYNFLKIPESVKYLFLTGIGFTKLPKIPDTIIDLSVGLHLDKVSLLKNTGDLSYLKNLKKFSVTYRHKHLEIGKLPESLRTFSAVGIHGTILLPEKFPKNLFFIHLHGFDKVSIPDLSYLKKLRVLSVFYCQIINYFKTPPVLDCELRFSTIKNGSLRLPSNYRKDRKKISFTVDKDS